MVWDEITYPPSRPPPTPSRERSVGYAVDKDEWAGGKCSKMMIHMAQCPTDPDPARAEWIRSIWEQEGVLMYSIVAAMDAYEREDAENQRWDRVKPVKDGEDEEEEWLDLAWEEAA